MANVDDNNYNIPSLTGNDTFLDWVNHYNTNMVNKLNKIKMYDGVSGDGIVFTLGTTAANDPLGGQTAGSDLEAGIIRASIAEVIPNGITFAKGVSIRGVLDYDLSKNELSAIKTRFHPYGGYTATIGFTFGMPVRIGSINAAGEEGSTGEANYYLARADSKSYAEVIGVVNGVTWPNFSGTSGPYTSTNTYIDVTTSGKIKGDFSRALAREGEVANPPNRGLSAGCVYFLSPGISGGLTRDEPVIAGQVSKPVLLGITGDEGLVLQYRGQFLQGSGTGGTGGIDNNRFIAKVDAGTDIRRGHVVGYLPTDTDGGDDDTEYGTDGWKIVRSTDTWIDNAIGVCVQDPFTLDSQTYIEVVSTGFIYDCPVADDAYGVGILYVNPDGKLISESGSIPGTRKAFAIGWRDHSAGTITANIINQSVGGGPAGSGTQTAGAGMPRNYGGGDNESWAYRSTSLGGATYGSAINENIIINGGFDVWQRGVGVESAGGGTGSMYLADRWVRIDGLSGNGGSVVNKMEVTRKEFTKNQTEVYGNPTYYMRHEHNISGADSAKGEFIILENRVEDVRTARNEDVTMSFFAKCGVTGSTMDINITQYDGSNVTVTKPASVQLGTLWDKYEISFNVPNCTAVPTGKHYVGFGFDIVRLGNTTLDLAQVKVERGLVATRNASSPDQGQKELEKCNRYYRRSYTLDERTGKPSMLNSQTPSISSVTFTSTPAQDEYEKFDVQMRDTPKITFYSPQSGYTGDIYNTSAQVDARNASGTVGYNGAVRTGTPGETCVTATYATKDGIYMFVPCGTVLWDDLAVHYVADSDLDENMPNKAPNG